jgi:steroid delta-isomerase-like uncharacterized protein
MREGPQDAAAPAEVLAALMAAYNGGAARDAARLYDAAGMHEDVAQGRRATGPEAIGDGLARFLGCFPDAHWAVDSVLTETDGAAAVYRLTGTLSADLGPFQASGQALDLAGVLVLTVRAGRITSSRDFWDAATLGRQLGGKR